MMQVTAQTSMPSTAAEMAITPPERRQTAQHATIAYFMMASITFTTLKILYNVSFMVSFLLAVIKGYYFTSPL